MRLRSKLGGLEFGARFRVSGLGLGFRVTVQGRAFFLLEVRLAL